MDIFCADMVLVRDYPTRVCSIPDCKTILSQSNPGDLCRMHEEKRQRKNLRGQVYGDTAVRTGDFRDPFVERLRKAGQR